MMRIGIGYDIHRLAAGRPLILGGVTIPFEKGLEGHSDGDAVCHAVMDALLGAAALGDIGRQFPDSDPAYAGADSLGLLEATAGLVRDAGYRVGNVDANIIANAPRLAPHVAAMRANVAEALGIAADRVTIKARTNEGLGPEGQGEALRAEAVELIERR